MIDNLIREAEEKLERLGADPETRHLYESREKQLRDELNRLNGAKQEGHVEGEHQKAIDVAKKMLNKGYPLDDIIEMSGLSKEEVERLQ